MALLKRGLAGEPVKILQAKLGVNADGQFGPATEEALKAYQKQHGLAADGIAGPDTFAALALPELVLLTVGSKGETVKKLQAALGITADGAYGAGTAKAVSAFQEKNGLEADGMAGPVTLAKIDVFAAAFSPEAVAKSQAAPGTVSAGGKPAEAGAAAAPKKSIWQSITEFFS
ncbi:peptidoglycan-binding protein [Xanthobacter dioxanivorans]|uniref:Peptidoglycan-binding protein n=1 Tax=Xanthobacter dioxanivorans TaxID=2528964 RepID=A0A974SG90_9HYPH|nr:peptidoglycan-binding protein [Xanthobacter dioxanivorans]QRG04495.1 peptidoglycan-binding protein [Xanthobacter dioxanivorans]